jgi:ethanolamine ammonia-lyase small subunit
MPTPTTPPDPWHALRAHTAARIALGRAGSSLPTGEWLRFAVAHALARDAVHAPLDAEALADALAREGLHRVALVHSAAGDRATYLRRPDLGRCLGDGAEAALSALARANGKGDAARLPATPEQGSGATSADGAAAGIGVAVMIGDGLSARAAQDHALPLLLALRPRLETQGLPIDAVVIARQARVALGDAVGAALGASAVLVLIGERPGLSSPDSLGAYLTWAPAIGRSDAERNCVSNIRPEGLPFDAAAARIAWLMAAARRLGATGVALKDESTPATLQAPAAPAAIATPAAPAAIATPASAPDAQAQQKALLGAAGAHPGQSTP